MTYNDINDKRINDWPDAPSFFDTREFREYTRRIEQIVRGADHALCTRDIHTVLDTEANYYWTMDALDSSKKIELVEGLISRWRPCDSDLPKIKSGKWQSGDDHEFLFAPKGSDTIYPDIGVRR